MLATSFVTVAGRRKRMNKIILTGRLGKDVDVKYTQSGKCVAEFSLAVQEGYGDKKTTTWINIVAWDKLAETCGNYLSKGMSVLVEGRLQIRSYDGKDGQKKYVTEVVAQSIEFLERKHEKSASGADGFGAQVFPDEPIPF